MKDLEIVSIRCEQSVRWQLFSRIKARLLLLAENVIAQMKTRQATPWTRAATYKLIEPDDFVFCFCGPVTSHQTMVPKFESHQDQVEFGSLSPGAADPLLQLLDDDGESLVHSLTHALEHHHGHRDAQAGVAHGES